MSVAVAVSALLRGQVALLVRVGTWVECAVAALEASGSAADEQLHARVGWVQKEVTLQLATAQATMQAGEYCVGAVVPGIRMYKKDSVPAHVKLPPVFSCILPPQASWTRCCCASICVTQGPHKPFGLLLPAVQVRLLRELLLSTNLAGTGTVCIYEPCELHVCKSYCLCIPMPAAKQVANPCQSPHFCFLHTVLQPIVCVCSHPVWRSCSTTPHSSPQTCAASCATLPPIPSARL